MVLEGFKGEVNRRIEVSCHTNVVFQGVGMVDGKEYGRKEVCGLEYDLLLIVLAFVTIGVGKQESGSA